MEHRAAAVGVAARFRRILCLAAATALSAAIVSSAAAAPQDSGLEPGRGPSRVPEGSPSQARQPVDPAVAAAAADTRPPLSDRSRELLDYRCASSLGARQVTLFANGTVRLREGMRDEPVRMSLGELGADELAGYRRRLEAEVLNEVEDERPSPVGKWIESCSLKLTLDDRPPRTLTFGPYDSLPLAMANLVRIADDLATHVLPPELLPAGYKPRPGDVLRRADGVLFEIVDFTADHKGLELRGRQQPLVLYLAPEDLPGLFIEVVQRGNPPGVRP